jgi:hypothetical protein
VLTVDLVLIVVFAAIGRRSHDESGAVVGVLSTAAPFLIGYTGSALATRLDRAPMSLTRAAIAWAPGIALGMVLRRLVFDRGTASSFVMVAFISTAVLLLGWRVIALVVGRVRRHASA